MVLSMEKNYVSCTTQECAYHNVTTPYYPFSFIFFFREVNHKRKLQTLSSESVVPVTCERWSLTRSIK